MKVLARLACYIFYFNKKWGRNVEESSTKEKISTVDCWELKVLFVTQEYDFFMTMVAQRAFRQLGMCVASNRCAPVKNTWCWWAVVSCACKLILFLFCLFTAVHKFDFRFVWKLTRNKWWPVEDDRDLSFWRDLYVLCASFAWKERVPGSHCQGQSFTRE